LKLARSTDDQVCAPNPGGNVNDAFGWLSSSHPETLSGMPGGCTSQGQRATWAFGRYYEAHKAAGGTCEFGDSASMQSRSSIEFASCAYPIQTPAPVAPTALACAPKTGASVSDLGGALGWVMQNSGVSSSGLPSTCLSDEAVATFMFSKYHEVKSASGATCDFGGVAEMQNVGSLTYPDCVYDAAAPPVPATPAPVFTPSPGGLVDGPCGYADDHCARSHGMLGNPPDQDCYGYSGQPWIPSRRDYCTLFGFGDRTFGLYDMDKGMASSEKIEIEDLRVQYAHKWSSQLATLRSRGTKIIGISAHNGEPVKNQREFLSTCEGCLTPGSVTKLDGLAYNAFVGWWSNEDRAGGRSGIEGSNRWSLDRIKEAYNEFPLPVYITNYSYLPCDMNTGICYKHSAEIQYNTMKAAEVFFEAGSPIVKVMWFSAWQPRDCTSNGWHLDYTPTTNCFNGFDTEVAGTTLGAEWLKLCSAW